MTRKSFSIIFSCCDDIDIHIEPSTQVSLLAGHLQGTLKYSVRTSWGEKGVCTPAQFVVEASTHCDTLYLVSSCGILQLIYSLSIVRKATLSNFSSVLFGMLV